MNATLGACLKRSTQIGQSVALLANVRLDCKGLLETNSLAYFIPLSVTNTFMILSPVGEKRTFYGRNR